MFAVTITAVFVISSILLILSTIAKDVKQATTWSPVVMMILLRFGWAKPVPINTRYFKNPRKCVGEVLMIK